MKQSRRSTIQFRLKEVVSLRLMDAVQCTRILIVHLYFNEKWDKGRLSKAFISLEKISAFGLDRHVNMKEVQVMKQCCTRFLTRP